jgi:HK97 family phage major capsid protein
MKNEVINNTYQELVSTILEAEKLAAKPNMSAAEVRMHSTLLAKISVLKMGVDPATFQAARVNSIRRELGMKDDAAVSEASAEVREAFRDFIRTGNVRKFEMRTDDQANAQWGRPSGASYLGGNLAGGTTSGKAGGFLTAPEFLAEAATTNLGDYDEIVDGEFSSIITTETGAVAPVPVVDDLTGSPAAFVKSQLVNDAYQIAQGSSLLGFKMSDKAIFGGAFKYQTALPVAIELEQDAAAVLAVLLPQIFRQRHQLALGGAFINGSGTGEPLGLATVAATLTGSNVTGSASSTIAGVTLKEFEAMYRAMPRQYRREAVFYMCSDMWLQVLELLEASGRPNVEGDNQRLFRLPIAVCDSMATPSNGNLAAVLACPRFLLQRRVRQNGIGVERAMETPNYIEQDLCLVKSYVRADLMPLLYTSAAAPYVSFYLHN